jgi:hypothetical protein
MPRDAYEVAQETQRRGGDDEKIQTAQESQMEVNGIRIASRDGKLHEMQFMADIAVGVPLLTRMVDTLWCDSRATHTWTISVDRPEDVEDAALLLEHWAIAAFGGHNGIWIERRGELVGEGLGPTWIDSPYDYFEDESAPARDDMH